MSNEIAVLAGLLGSLSAVVALAFLGVQIRDSRRLARAEFISSLENDSVQHYGVYRSLLPGETWSRSGSGPENSADITAIIPYLGFFAKIKFLLDLKAIDFDFVDRMFVFRFFLAAHNPHVQKLILYADLYETCWCEIFALHRQWIKYRQTKGLTIPFEDASLEALCPDRYQEMLRAFERRLK